MTNRSRTLVLSAVLAAALCGTSPAEDAAPPEERFAGRIRAYTDAAANTQKELGSLMDLASQAAAFTRGDIVIITKQMEDVAATYTAAVEALKKGDEASANTLVRKAEDLNRHRDRWVARLSHRMRQAQNGEYLPASKESYDILIGWHRPDDIREIDAYFEAKKARCEAYDRLAEATDPSADEQVLQKLADEVFEAETEVQIANLRLGWAKEDSARRTWTTTDATVTSPELTQALQRLTEWRREYEQLYRRSRTAERAFDQYKRTGGGLSDAVVKAYQAAKAEKDRIQRELEQKKKPE